MSDPVPGTGGAAPAGAAPSEGAPPGARRVAGASLWAGGGMLARQGLRLGSNLVFARMLFPEAFGLMAIVNAVRTGLEMFSDLGIAPSIVQSKRGTDPVFLDTAWTLQILRGVVLFLITLVLAWPLAELYGEPQLAGLLPVAGAAALIASFSSTELAIMRRKLSVRNYEAIYFAGQLASSATILVWLLISPTVWALVAGGLVASSVRVLLSRAAASHRDRLRWDGDAARELFHFGKWIFLSTVATFLADEADRLLLAKLADIGQLGVYSIALMFATLPATLIHRVGTMVVFPALSRSHEAGRDLGLAYRRIRRPLLAIGGIGVTALAAGAIPMIETLYDDRYAEAGWMLQLLAVGSWFRILEVPGRFGLLAVGESRWLVVLNTVKLVGVLVGLPLGFAAGGFAGGIAALIAADAARYLTCAAAAWRHGLRSPWMDLVASLGVFGATAAGIVLGGALSGAGHPAWLTFLGASAGAVLVFSPFAVVLAMRSGAHRLLRPGAR